MTSTPPEPPSTTTTSKTNRPPISDILPPLIFGTATFNHQYNTDPYALNTTALVHSALTHGIRAFDTSPYYGPSETLLGTALSTPSILTSHPRESYFLLTKVGRISADTFDYSPAWIRDSVSRSLSRLHTSYLDVVYCHDVEFVSPAEVLTAVTELRRLRDEEGKVRYVGISGYPPDVLASLAELVLKETGEPLDIIQSYANYTLQNQALATYMPRFVNAGVDVVPNASPLGMGLLRRQGVPVGALGDFHPAPDGLREAVAKAVEFCEQHGEGIEVVALRWALERWLCVGSDVGSKGDLGTGFTKGKRVGVSVIGVSKIEELEDTMGVWRSILDGLEGERGGEDRVGGQDVLRPAGRWSRESEWSRNRKQAVELLADGVREILGEWWGYTWDSPDRGFVERRKAKEEKGGGEK